MTKSTLGLHAVDGSKNGYGLTAPYARGVVSFIHGDIDKRLQNPEVSQDCFTVWRDIAQWAIDPTDPDSPTNSDAPPGLEQWTTAQARANARVQWPRTSARWREHPATAYKLTNEIGGSDRKVIENLIAFEDELMIINEEEGQSFTFFVASCAGDSPHWDSGVWQELFAPHIYKAWGMGHIYSRHAYCGVNDSDNKLMIKDGKPADNNVNRPFREINYFLQTYNTCGPIVLGESGYVTHPGEPLYSEQMIAYDNYIRSQGFDQWIGFQCCFTYGEWWEANMQNSSQALGSWMSQNQPAKWEPTFNGETPMPETKPKIVIVKKPQKADMTEAENQTVSKWAWDNYGRTTTHSADDMLTMLRGGNAESYAVIWWPQRQPGVIEALEAEGFGYITVNDSEPEPFSFVSWPTPHKTVTQEFLANPQNYAQFGLPGHDGIDIRAYHGDAIYAVADGTISQVNHDPAKSNYGIYVRVAHKESYETTYAHLKETIRTVGESVTAGDIIGLADNTGNSFGDHLHLTLKRTGYSFTDRCGNQWPYNIVDPTSYLEHFKGVTWPGGSPGFDCPGEPEPPPTGETYNTADFMIPDPRSWVVVDRGAAGGEDIWHLFKDGEMVRVKNRTQGEWYTADGLTRIRDTSPQDDPTFGACLYLQHTNGRPGGQIAPSICQVGVTYEYSSDVQFKRKIDCQNLDYRSGNGRSSFQLREVIENHTFPNGVTVDRLFVTVQTGEIQLYAIKDGVKRGWCGGGAEQAGNVWAAMPREFHLDRAIPQEMPPTYCS